MCVYQNKNNGDNSRIILSDVAFSGPVVTDTRIAQSPYYLVWPTRRQPHFVHYISSLLSSVHVSTTDGQISFFGRTFLPSPTPCLVNPYSFSLQTHQNSQITPPLSLTLTLFFFLIIHEKSVFQSLGDRVATI